MSRRGRRKHPLNCLFFRERSIAPAQLHHEIRSTTVELRASSESYRLAGAALEKTRNLLEPFLNTAFAASSLANLHCKLRYVPIVMPENMHAQYPARSKLRKKERIYDCAPILDYEVFVEGTFGNHLKEYLRGIALSAPHLAGLGASKQQIAEVEPILATAAEHIMVAHSNPTRH